MTIKNKLPYTEAAVMEVLRMSVTAPFGVGHYNAVPIEVNGITIPANTMILPLFRDILRGKHWGPDVNQFK